MLHAIRLASSSRIGVGRNRAHQLHHAAILVRHDMAMQHISADEIVEGLANSDHTALWREVALKEASGAPFARVIVT